MTMGRRILGTIVLVALFFQCSDALDSPRSFLRRVEDKSDKLNDAILSGPAPKERALTEDTKKIANPLAGVHDKLRRLVEKPLNSTDTSEEAIVDEVVPQVVEIIISALADTIIAELVTTLGASEDGPLDGAVEEVINIVVLAVAGSLITAIVTTILGDPEQRAVIAAAFAGNRRRLQFDGLLEEIVPQVLEIIIFAIAGALVSVIVGAFAGILGGGISGVLEEVLNVVFLAVAGAILAAIVAAIFPGEEVSAFLVNAFNGNRRLQTEKEEVNEHRELQDGGLLESILPQILEIIVFAVAGAVVSAIVGSLGGGPVAEEVLNVIVLAVAGAVVSAIVAAIFGGGEVSALISNAFNRRLDDADTEASDKSMPSDADDPHRQLQDGGLLESILPQIIEIIVFAVAGAVVSAIVGALGGGPVAEEVVNIIVLAVSGAVISAIVAAIFGGGNVAALFTDAFDRRLVGTDAKVSTNSTSSDVEVEADTFRLVRLIIIALIVAAIVGGGGNTPPELDALLGRDPKLNRMLQEDRSLLNAVDQLRRRQQAPGKPSPEVAKNETGEVEEETISEIISAVLTAVIDAAVVALTQAIIDAILGILGIPPALSAEQETEAKPELNSTRALLNDRTLMSTLDHVRRAQGGPGKPSKPDGPGGPAKPAKPAKPTGSGGPVASTSPKVAKNETGQVEAETISVIISAVISAVIDAVIVAVTQAIIDAILGIVGISPAVTEERLGGNVESALSRVRVELDTLIASIPQLNATSLDDFLDDLNTTGSLLAPDSGRALLNANRKRPLGRVRGPRVGNDDPVREPQGDTLLIIVLASRVVKAVIAAVLIALIVQAIGGGGETPEARGELLSRLTQRVDNLMANETVVSKSRSGADLRTILGIGDGDGILEIPVLLVRLFVALILIPITFVVAIFAALLGAVCGGDDCLRIDNLRARFTIDLENAFPASANVTQLVTTAIEDLGVNLSSLNVTALTDQFLSIIETFDLGI